MASQGCEIHDIACTERNEQWQCRLVSDLCGVALDRCVVAEDVCKCCLTSTSPRSTNYATCSIAITAARLHLPLEEFRKVKGDLSQFLLNEVPPEPKGAGTELKKMLSWLGIVAESGCDCRRREHEMNRNGCDWCLANAGEIVGWMEEEATKRNMPFVRGVAMIMVKVAVRRARRQEVHATG